jgi:hypothetical protein
MAKAQLKVTNKCTSDLGTIVMHTVELLDADGVMKEYGIKDYHDDNGIFDTEIEDIETGENIYIGSTLGKRIIDELDEYDNDNDNTSSTGDSVKDVINEYIANQQAKNDNVSVSEKVNYFLTELGINDDDLEDQIHNLIVHHIDVPCSAELDNQMYNESI